MNSAKLITFSDMAIKKSVKSAGGGTFNTFLVELVGLVELVLPVRLVGQLTTNC